MVLDDVAQAAGSLVKRAAATHAEILGQRDLDAGHAIAVPDRLEEGIGEAEIKDVHDRLLAEEVIDAEDRIFREHRPRDAIELPRRGQVASEWFFDDDARVLGQARGAEPFDNRREQRGRDRKVMRWASGIAQRPFERLERGEVVVVAVDVAQQGEKMAESAPVIDPAELFYAVRRPSAKLRQAPLRGGDADHRDVED